METDHFLLLVSSIIHDVGFLPITLGISIGLIVNILLLLMSALISGSEVAYFSLKPKDLNELKEQKSKKNRLILQLLKNKERLLATILIGNNFINVGIVILTSFVANNMIDFGINNTIKIVFEITFITALILFFGEILPKVYASQSPKKFAGVMAYPLWILTRLLKPLSLLLVRSTKIVNKRMTRKIGGLSMDDISHALELTGSDITEEKEILEGIVKFGNIDVAEIMTARVDVIDVEVKSDYNKLLQTIIESGYSRIPIFEETPDNVKGILYVKDLLPHLSEQRDFIWQSLIRDAYYVPETKMINDLLAEFQSEKIHMSIVVDEYGGTSGIITLEDILEEIVGDISDESDEEENFYSKQPDGSWIFEGKTNLNDFHKVTETDEDSFDNVRGDAESLAGLILEIRGEIPAKHEVIDFKNFQFTILSADNRRVKKVKFEFKKKK